MYTQNNQGLDRTKIKLCCLIFPQYGGNPTALAFTFSWALWGSEVSQALWKVLHPWFVLHKRLSATFPGQIEVLRGPWNEKGLLPGLWGLYGLAGTLRSHLMRIVMVKH